MVSVSSLPYSQKPVIESIDLQSEYSLSPRLGGWTGRPVVMEVVAANMMVKQWRTADKLWSSNWGVGRGIITHSLNAQ
jgi:hypothetical protein